MRRPPEPCDRRRVVLLAAGLAPALGLGSAACSGSPAARPAPLALREPAGATAEASAARPPATDGVALERELLEAAARGEQPPVGSPAAVLQRALRRWRDGDTASSRASLERLAADATAPVLTWTLLARACLADGDAQAALAALDRGDAAAAAAAPHPDHGWLRGAALLQAGRDRDGERVLRDEIATGARPAAAARVLVAHLRDAEDLAGGLAVAEAAAARERAAGPRRELHRLRAELLIDLARPNEALAVLDEIATGGVAEPRERLLSVIAARFAGRLDRALRDTDALLAGDDAWTAAQRGDLLELRDELAAERRAGSRRGATLRETLALLRGAETALRRRAALRVVVDSQALRPDPESLARAVRIGLADPAPAVRVAALRAWAPHAGDGLDPLLRQGLEDPDGIVRGAAAALLPGLGVTAARRIALEFLAAEREAYAGRQLHEALVELCGRRLRWPGAGFADPDVRARLVAAWRALANS